MGILGVGFEFQREALRVPFHGHEWTTRFDEPLRRYFLLGRNGCYAIYFFLLMLLVICSKDSDFDQCILISVANAGADLLFCHAMPVPMRYLHRLVPPARVQQRYQTLRTYCRSPIFVHIIPIGDTPKGIIPMPLPMPTPIPISPPPIAPTPPIPGDRSVRTEPFVTSFLTWKTTTMTATTREDIAANSTTYIEAHVADVCTHTCSEGEVGFWGRGDDLANGVRNKMRARRCRA